MLTLISSAAATLLDEEDDDALPLGLADLSTLPSLFVAFVNDIYTGFRANPANLTHQLTKDIYLKWIIYLLQPTANVALKSIPGDTAPITSKEQFFSLLRKTPGDLALPQDKYNFLLFQYIGLYHFVIWCFCNNFSSVTSLQFDTPSTRVCHLLPYDLYTYVKNTLNSKSYKINDKLELVVKDDFFTQITRSGWQAVDLELPANAFIRGFVHDLSLAETTTNPLTSISANSLTNKIGLHTVVTRLRNIAPDKTQNITFSQLYDVAFRFIKDFRDVLNLVVDRELRGMLAKISADILEKYGSFAVYVTGDGSGTRSFFGRIDFGLAFLTYELRGNSDAVDSSNLKYLGLENPIPTIPLRAAGAPPQHSSFVAYLGLDQGKPAGPANRNVVTVEAGHRTKLTLYATNSDDCYLTVFGGTGEASYFSVGTIKGRLVANPGLGELSCRFSTRDVNLDSNGLPTGEELLLLVFNNSVPIPAAADMATVDFDFTDNEFQIPQAGFWPDVDALDDIISALGQSADFRIVSQLEAAGVGRRLPSSAAHQSKVVMAEDQRETKQAKEEQYRKVRYAFGSLSWYPGSGGEPDCLEFDTKGFVSPLRTTWKTWPPLAAQQTVLQSRIGRHMTVYNPADGPVYGPALSAFRAFSMLEAMILRLEARATVLLGNGILTAAAETQIRTALDNHLKGTGSVDDKARVSFRQPPLNNTGPLRAEATRIADELDDQGNTLPLGSVIYVDYQLFHKFDH